MLRNKRDRILKALPEFLKEYCNQSTIQGLNHIVAPKRHFIERAVWLLIVITAITSASRLIYSSYQRYQSDPTVISLNKNYRNWNTPLPATTICFTEKLNFQKSLSVIKRFWSVEEGEARYEYYTELLGCLANSKYDTLNACLKFSQDQSLKSLGIASLIDAVNFEPEKFSGATFKDDKMDFHRTLTEMGICFSHNSLLTQYFHLGKKPDIEAIDPPMCRISKPLCYGRMLNLPRSLYFFTHSPYDIPVETTGVLAPIGYETRAQYQALSTEASETVRKLHPSQRRCLFFDEVSSGEAPYYTYHLCLMNCRRDLAIKLCGCVPFFYMKRENQQQCTILDVPCLTKHSLLLKTLVNQEDNTKYQCHCMQDCSSIVYYKTSVTQLRKRGSLKGKQNNQSAIYEWALERLPRTKLQRDVIYNAEDLLVAWGGIAGLFLGCSIISGIEIVYFFTFRLIRCIYLSSSRSKKKKFNGITKRKPHFVLPLLRANQIISGRADFDLKIFNHSGIFKIKK